MDGSNQLVVTVIVVIKFIDGAMLGVAGEG
jgi:hypothetical protein